MVKDPMETTHEWEVSDRELYARFEDEVFNLTPASLDDQINELQAAMLRPDRTDREKQFMGWQREALQAARRIQQRKAS